MASRVLCVLAGGDNGDGQLSEWAASAEVLYAADSAANRLVRLGFRPIVVGDLDSFDPTLEPQVESVHGDPDPDRTDFDKVLARVESEGHQGLTVIGFEGDLFDHMLAGLSSIARSVLVIRIVLRQGIARVIRPQQSVVIEDAFGRRVSLLPVTRCTGVSLSGVLWEVADAVMEPGGFLSVSNEGVGRLSASLRTGTAILFVGRGQEEPVEW